LALHLFLKLALLLSECKSSIYFASDQGLKLAKALINNALQHIRLALPAEK
jgi:hypothetical protein